jgi:hypothetical protein
VGQVLLTIVRRQANLLTLLSEKNEITVLTVTYESALQQNITPQGLTAMKLFVYINTPPPTHIHSIDD